MEGTPEPSGETVVEDEAKSSILNSGKAVVEDKAKSSILNSGETVVEDKAKSSILNIGKQWSRTKSISDRSWLPSTG